MCTFGRAASSFELFQCVLLVEVKVSTLKVQFVSLSAHCGNAENTFQHLWTNYYYYYWYSALGPVWAESRVQSGDWYDSGTLHSGQVLRGSLPLLSPVWTNIFLKILCQPNLRPLLAFSA